MKISSSSWKSYVDRLSKIDQIAAGKVSEWYRNHPDADIEELINVTYYYCDHYGDAAGALACEMYDEIAMASGKTIPPAEPAKTAAYGEIASALQGALLRTQDPDAIGSIAGRKVKTVGLDTLLNNSLRDGAEFAWIPSGDTCAFCIMLASNGWQKASKRALKNGHAEHVHSNCDCTYAIRFDENTEVEGYDPDYYKKIYGNAEGDNWKGKVNSIRRAHYAANKDIINYQKRVNYANRMRSEGHIVWPKNGKKVSRIEFKEIREYAKSKGIAINGIKDSMIDKTLAFDIIDKTAEMIERYDLANKFRFPFTVDFSHSLRSIDFAESYPDTYHIIYFNKDAYRSLTALEREYSIIEKRRFFVKGTTYRSIPYHEMGHIVEDVYGIDSMEIAKRILNVRQDSEVLELLSEILSEYSSAANGGEIISECFSAYYSGVANDFVLKFMEECDKIIAMRR